MTAAKVKETWTDDGNGRRFVRQHGDDVRYVPQWGWLFWDNKRWRRDDCGEIHRRAKQTARSIWKEQSTATTDDEKVAIAKHARASHRSNAIDAMMKMASTEPEIIASPDQFDRHPMLLTVNNGTIDLTTGTLREHRRADYITKMAPVDYDPNATCPTFDRFLSRIMAGKKPMIKYVRRAAGYSLTGETREQCLFFLWGTGSNGKGAFIRTIEALAGDHFRKTPFETLLERKSEAIREDVAELAGARFVSAEEKSGPANRFDEGLVKTLTGQDTISARFLHTKRFTFRPVFKIWLAANHKPTIRGTDEGIWRRVKLIPFTVTVKKPDPTLEPTIQGPELPGVLAWAVRGAVEWLQDGLAEPNAVRVATREYREEQDILGTFFAECCEIDKKNTERSAVLYARYHAWAVVRGYRSPMTDTAFGSELTDRGFKRKRDGKGHIQRLGLRLKLTELSEPSSNGSNGSNGSSGNSAGIIPRKKIPENHSNYSNCSTDDDEYARIERAAMVDS
jgi:putative DNA primase/helicase